MVRRRARLAAGLAGGAALVGAVALLRGTAGIVPPPEPVPAPPPPVVQAVTAPEVSVPRLPPAPATPQGARFSRGAGATVLAWEDVPGAAGYEVRWRSPGRPDAHRLVVPPRLAITGVPARASVSVAVRAVDPFGRRSAPLRVATGDLAGGAGPTPPLLTAFVDRFSSPGALDRSRWRLPEGAERCLVRGAGSDLGFLVVAHRCGPLALRAGAPLELLDPAPDGTRGRFLVVTDAPDRGDELMLALLPGSVAGLPPELPALPAAGSAAIGLELPPGAVLLRITPDGPALTLGAGTAPIGLTAEAPALPTRPSPGAPRRWELRIADGRLTVLRDDIVLLDAAVALPWQRATAVIGVLPGERDEGRTRVDEVQLTGPAVPPAPLRVVELGTVPPPLPETTTTPVDAEALHSAEGLRLLGWLRPAAGSSAPSGVEVSFAGSDVPLQPAVPGRIGPDARSATPPPGAAVPVMADLPVAGGPAELRLRGAHGAQLVGAVLEVRVRPESVTAPLPTRLPLAAPPAPPPPTPRLRLSVPDGAAVDPAALPRGPLRLEITVDGLPGQSVAGQAAGYVGLEVDFGGRRLLGLPTAWEGPAVAGRYEFTLDTTGLPAGEELLAVRVVGVDPGAAPGLTVLPVRLP